LIVAILVEAGVFACLAAPCCHERKDIIVAVGGRWQWLWAGFFSKNDSWQQSGRRQWWWHLCAAVAAQGLSLPEAEHLMARFGSAHLSEQNESSSFALSGIAAQNVTMAAQMAVALAFPRLRLKRLRVLWAHQRNLFHCLVVAKSCWGS